MNVQKSSLLMTATLSPPPSPPHVSKEPILSVSSGEKSKDSPPKKKRHPSFQLDKLFFKTSTNKSMISPPVSARPMEDREFEDRAQEQLSKNLSPLAISDAHAGSEHKPCSPRSSASSAYVPSTAAENSEIANINAQADAQGRRVIFVPIANDPHSVSRQVAWLLESGILKPESDLVVLAHVRAPYHKESFYGPEILTDYTDVIVSSDDIARRQARALVSKTAEFLAKHNIAVRAIIVQGESAHTIVRKAHELSASLVILGDNKGEGVFKRAIHGSTTDFCTHHLKCTMVIAK